MENLKENVQKIEELKKKNYQIKTKIDELVDISTELYHKNYDQFKINDKKIKNYKKQIELNNIKIAILKNNIHYLLKMDFEGIKGKILEYFINKKIGEKTKEKIENEIKEYFNNNYNIKIACYISSKNKIYYDNSILNYKITFYFLNNDNYKSYILGYNEEFSIEFDIELKENKENNIKTYYYNNIDEYININNLNSKATELLKEYTKTVNKIEKLRKEQQELYHNFMDYQQAFLNYYFNINTKLNIY